MTPARNKRTAAAPRPIAAIQRGLTVLDAFLDGPPLQDLDTLAARTGLAPPALTRILATLEKSGYAQQRSDHAWQIGPMPLRLSNRFQQGMQLEDMVPPILRGLVEATGECATYFVPRERLRINLYRVLSPQAVRDQGAPGDVAAIDSGAAGAIFVAWGATRKQRARAAQQDVKPALVAVCAELHPGMTGMSSPVFGGDQQCVGALTLTGPAERFTRAAIARWQPLLRAAAFTITERIGGDGRVFDQRRVRATTQPQSR